ncbi:MAG: C45 family autoproteolytic acyltransferase/hydrolase [Thermomicrobiales bacterium]
MSSLPLLHLTGTSYEQGVRHGQALRDQIAHNLAVYFARFEREVRLPRAETLRRAVRYLAALDNLAPAYAAGVRGIAAGAGADVAAIAALNVRYELLYYQFGVNALAAPRRAPMPDGCTAFAVRPAASATGHLLLGENWDWIPETTGALLHTVEPDGLETLTFTEAGIFGGKIGLNSAGLGLAINGLATTDDDWARLRLPFHARCHAILRSRDLAAATAVITGASRACSTNFLLAQAPDQVVNLEAAPEKIATSAPETGCFCHTSHFLRPRALGVIEPPIERGLDSYDRLDRMQTLLASKQPIAVGDLQHYLRDHAGAPDAICRHPDPAEPTEERYATVVSVIMDLHERVLWISDGPPCERPYQEVRLGG